MNALPRKLCLNSQATVWFSKCLQLSVSVSMETVFRNQLVSRNHSLRDNVPIRFLKTAHMSQYVVTITTTITTKYFNIVLGMILTYYWCIHLKKGDLLLTLIFVIELSCITFWGVIITITKIIVNMIMIFSKTKAVSLFQPPGIRSKTCHPLPLFCLHGSYPHNRTSKWGH
jgi:hypothetical protein